MLTSVYGVTVCVVCGKGKAVPLQSWTVPEGSRSLNRHMNVVRLSALRTGCLYPQEIFLVLILLGAESTPGPQCGRKDYVNEKFPMTPSGIEPTTFRPVAQCLNHLRHRCVMKEHSKNSVWLKILMKQRVAVQVLWGVTSCRLFPYVHPKRREKQQHDVTPHKT